MAKGSHQTYGGWEPRACWVCGQKTVQSRVAAMHCCPADGEPFSLCSDHIGSYPEALAASAVPATVVDVVDEGEGQKT